VIKKGQLIEDAIYSRFLQETIPLLIYLPHNYSELYKYPVLFLQDGWEYLHLGKITTQMEQLIAEKRIHELILVSIPVINKEERRERYTPGSEKNQLYIRFLVEELVPHIDRSYSTLYLGGGRGIAGDSLGAVVSIHTAISYPNTFSKVIAQSPLLLPETEIAIRDIGRMETLQFYLSVGKGETQVETSRGILNLVQMNMELHQLLQGKAQVSLVLHDGEHNWGAWQKDLQQALVHFWSR
jgi:enterochelin esterase-like enzyme